MKTEKRTGRRMAATIHPVSMPLLFEDSSLFAGDISGMIGLETALGPREALMLDG